MEKNLQPDMLDEICALCEGGLKPVKPDNLKARLKGALIGRFAGCLLGVPVENWKIADMQNVANNCGMDFPPTTYWKEVGNPDGIQYGVSPRRGYTESGMNGVAVDDDITYTALNLLLLEKYGKNYTVEDVGQLWLDILPYACTAEDVALKELRKGTKAKNCADNNEYVEWIGAAIRADAFGYAEAGNPEKASMLCYNDAYLSHRKNGIYGEMFCSATIASAFTSRTPLEAIKNGMKYIPKTSELYEALEWALGYEGKLTDYLHARKLLDEKFSGMHCVHTINNMCAIVFALILGGNDFTACISSCIAIGLDNDCTGATVGSIVGACLSIDGIDKKWYENFNDKVLTYITGYPEFSIDDMVERFYKLNEEE